MLSLFPSLLTFEQLAPTLIRVVLGLIVLHWLYKSWKNPSLTTKQRIVSAVEGLAGVLVLIGYMTQLGALIIFIDMLVRVIQKIGRKQFLTDGVNYYLIVLVLALSLLFSGAGLFAFDLPL